MTNEQDRSLLIRLRIPVRWGDMDALGHVNNAVYFSYCEQARVSWLAQIGWGDSVSGQGRLGPVIVNASCEFLKPVVFPAEVEVCMYGGPPGRSSFQTYYEIRAAEAADTLYTTGHSKVVWVDHEAGRSTPLPDEVRRLLPENNEHA